MMDTPHADPTDRDTPERLAGEYPDWSIGRFKPLHGDVLMWCAHLAPKAPDYCYDQLCVGLRGVVAAVDIAGLRTKIAEQVRLRAAHGLTVDTDRAGYLP